MAAPKRKKHAGGRPRAIDAKKQRDAIRWAKEGNSLNAIARRLGVDRSTLDAERKTNAEFGTAMMQADGEGEMFWVGIVRKCGQGKGSTVQLRAAIQMLTRKWWQDWAERKPDAPTPEKIVGALTYLFDRMRTELPKQYHGILDESINDLGKFLDPQPHD